MIVIIKFFYNVPFILYYNKVKKILRLTDEMGEKISHVKCSRKRWYSDAKWADKSKPPLEALVWSISVSYHSNEEADDNEKFDETVSAGGGGSNHDNRVGNGSGSGIGIGIGNGSGSGSGSRGGNGNGSSDGNGSGSGSGG